MISLPNFPQRVRIHAGGFDASARAMHREAALEMVSSATIERIQMSTKTTIKRVALVAVAAMGFGLLSVVPSSAVVQSDTLTLGASTASAAIGDSPSTTVTQTFLGIQSDTMSVTASLVSGPSGNAVVPLLTSNEGSTVNGSLTSGTGGQVVTWGDTKSATVYSQATAVFTVKLSSVAVAGTYVVKLTPTRQDAVAVNAAAQTWTVTVAAVAVADSSSTAYKKAGAADGDPTSDALAISALATTANTQIATILVTPMAGTTNVAATTTLSASISGPGNIGIGTTNSAAQTGRSVTAAGKADTYKYVTVWSDGTTGSAVVSITIGGVTVTKTITMAGAAASLIATPVKKVIGIGSTDVAPITAKDSLSNSAAVPALTVTSATTSVATVAVSGTNVTVTGVAVGTSVITVSSASPALSTTYTVTVGSATSTTLTLTTDKSAYNAGDKVTVTVTALGTDGKAIGDNSTFAAFDAAVVSSVAVQGTLPTASVAIVSGVATFTIYAPLAGGTVTLNTNEGAGTANVAGGGTKAAISASFDVSNPSQDAATDAANAATDAANYAADAADAATTAAEEATAAAQDAGDAAKAAQDSADAATAAVVDLGLKVTGLIASLRAQLTALTNLIVKIQAQVAKLPKK